MSTVQLLMFHCGYGTLQRRWITSQGAAAAALLPYLGFCLVHPTRGPVLIDAPHGARGFHGYGRLRGAAVSLLSHGRFEPGWSVAGRLRQAGLDPADVREGVFTHVHLDHTGGVHDFPRARWHLGADELTFIRDAQASPLRRLLIAPKTTWADLQAVSDRLSPVTCDGPTLDPFGPTCDLFGDGSALLVPLPGHAPGHQGVLVRTPSGRQTLLCGDAAFLKAHVQTDDPGPLVLSFAEHRAVMLRTLERLRAFRRAQPHIDIFPSHDSDLGQRCMDGPVWVE